MISDIYSKHNNDCLMANSTKIESRRPSEKGQQYCSAYHNYEGDYGADESGDYYHRARDNDNLCCVSFRELRPVCRVPRLPSALPTDPLFKIHAINISFKVQSFLHQYAAKSQLKNTARRHTIHLPPSPSLPPSYMNTHSLPFCLSLSLPLFPFVFPALLLPFPLLFFLSLR